MQHGLRSSLAVGVALEGVDIQVVVIVLFFLRCRFGRGGAAEQLESLKCDHAEQGDDDGDKDNLSRLGKLREARGLFLGVVVGEALVIGTVGIRRCRGCLYTGVVVFGSRCGGKRVTGIVA